MNQSACWLDALPPDAPERELLAAAERDLPPPGSIDRNWNALCAAAVIMSVSAAVSTSAAASSASAAGAAGPSVPIIASKGVVLGSAATAAKTAVGLIGLPVAIKSIAIGFTVGVGALGTGQLVQSLHRSEPPQIAAVVPSVPRPSERSRRPASLPSVTDVTVAAGDTTNARRENAAQTTEPLRESEPVPRNTAQESDTAHASSSRIGYAPTAVAHVGHGNSRVSPARPRKQQAVDLAAEKLVAPVQAEAALLVAEAPLSLQAAELAKIKGLLDSGAPREALSSLRASLDSHALWAIAEDRDALYIEALKRTNHVAEARRAAASFFARYPNSPQRDRLRALVAAE